MADNLKYAQLQPFIFAGSGPTIGDTSVVVARMTDIDGTDLAMTDFGTKGFCTAEPGSGTQEEQFVFTGLVQNSNNTTTLTGISNVDFLAPYTETSAFAKSHAGGTQFVISNTSGFYNTLTNKDDDETIVGLWQFPNGANTPVLGASYVAPTLAPQVASKGYVDSVAISGAPDADTVTKGIVQIATGAQLAAGTGAGSTGATLVSAGSSFTNTSAGAGDVNKVPVLNASGNLAAGFIANASTTVAGKSELATGAETAAGTATGGTGAALVPANSSFIATSSGAADANKVPVLGSSGTIADGFTYEVGTSGEALSVGQGVYLKASDGKLYRTIGTSDEPTFSFVGIVMDAAAAADLSVRFAAPGQVARGLSGIVAGSQYFVTDVAGTLGTTPGTRFARVGRGLSTTTMLVLQPKFIVSGVSIISATGNTVITTGFYPARVTVSCAPDAGTGDGNGGISVGDDTNRCSAAQMGSAANLGLYVSNRAWYNYNTNTTTLRCAGTIDTKTATGFTFNTATFSANGHTALNYTAFSE